MKYEFLLNNYIKLHLKTMIYSDGIHIISSISLAHLHLFCQTIGIKRCWYHAGSKFPHYDIPKKMRASFFACCPQVEKVSSREIVKILKHSYKS